MKEAEYVVDQGSAGLYHRPTDLVATDSTLVRYRRTNEMNTCPMRMTCSSGGRSCAAEQKLGLTWNIKKQTSTERYARATARCRRDQILQKGKRALAGLNHGPAALQAAALPLS